MSIAPRRAFPARAVVSRLASGLITSDLARDLRRGLGRRPGPPVVEYFHQVDDPYSHLAAQMLGLLARRYGATVRPWLVPPPDAAAAPERERLAAYALRDAGRLAAEYGLAFPPGARSPSPERARAANAELAAGLAVDGFAERAVAVGARLWAGEAAADEADGAAEAGAVAALAEGEARRRRLGHYLGAMTYFEGEWFWGVDRLNHLEERLAARGFDGAPENTPALVPYRAAGAPSAGDLHVGLDAGLGRGPTVELWFSFRSPYTWLAFPRVRRLARRYGADLRLRYILPMVMRGLPVPLVKRRYILLDAKREADRAGLPFGRIVDPVGAGAERALAVAHRALALGSAEAFCEEALRAAFAEGVDLASDRGLYGVARRAGLGDAQVDEALVDQSWRAAAEENRRALFEAGLWGAPTFRVGGAAAHWGQDRLWALEADLRAATGRP